MGPRSFYVTFFGRCFQPFLSLASAGLLLMAPLLSASSFQSLEEIQQEVHRYLQESYQNLSPERMDIHVSSLDRRLQLAQCSQALNRSHKDTSQTGGSLSVHVRCDGERPWAVYVPAQVSLYRSLPLASRQLERGEIINRADIETRVVNISQQRQGVITDTESLIGMEVKRSLTAGDVFRSAAVEAPLLVRRGDQVSIELQMGSLSVTTSGTAMAQGRQGDRIRVRNSQSDRIVTVEVVAVGRVRTAI